MTSPKGTSEPTSTKASPAEPGPEIEKEPKEPDQDQPESAASEPTRAAPSPLALALPSLEPRTMSEVIEMGEIFAQSGLFPDIRNAWQAAAKIIYGRSIGFGAVESMTGMHIIDGKPVAGASIIAAAVRRHPHYDFRVIQLTNEVCEIQFTTDGEPLGTSVFTIGDARHAGLIREKSAWDKFPRNMLFARAISNGQKWWCPDVFNMPVYTAEEMGAENVDEDGALIIDQIASPVVARGLEPSDRRIDTAPRTPPRAVGPTHTQTISDDDLDKPWQEYIQDWGADEWKVFWPHWSKQGLTRQDVHEALGNPTHPDDPDRVSVYGFTGTRRELGERLTAAIRAKRARQRDDQSAPDPRAGQSAKRASEGGDQSSSAPPEPEQPFVVLGRKPGQIKLDGDEGYINVARIVATGQVGKKPLLEVWGKTLNDDDTETVDALPCFSREVSAKQIREWFDHRNVGPIIAEGTTIYNHETDVGAITLHWRRVNGQIAIDEALDES